MTIRNVHYRDYSTSIEQLGAALETLSTASDQVWPSERWLPVVLSDGLNVGSSGGHGPIRYFVEAHEPSQMVRFRFTGPRGFDGTHTFSMVPTEDGRVRLTHAIDMESHGSARLSWPLLFRPLHDALMEDALERVAQALDPSQQRPAKHSAHVKLLRKLLAAIRRRRQR